MLSPARNEAVSSSFRTVLLRQSPHTLPSACRRRPRLQQRSSDDKTARRWQKQGFPGRGRKCEHPVAGCCCSSSIRLPRSSIMSGFFWCSWSKLVRAHRAPPPQLRYTTLHSPPGRVRDCLYCTIDSSRLNAEPPTCRTPRPAASTVTAGPAPGRSFARHHRHAPSPTPVTWASSLSLLSTSRKQSTTWAVSYHRSTATRGGTVHFWGGSVLFLAHEERLILFFVKQSYGNGNQEVQIQTQNFNRTQF